MPRHLPGVASWVALLVAVSGVVVYAVQADGYQAHTTELNDGGIWVTSNQDGSYGRINKPIGELDGTVFSRLDSNLDIVQDGSSVVGVDLSDATVVALDPSQMRMVSAEQAAIPTSPAVGMAGGSVAVLDTETGRLWAATEDPDVGVPSLSSLSAQNTPLASVGEDAALAVGLDGTIHAVSAAQGKLLTLRRDGDVGFAGPMLEDLPGPAFSDAIAVTAVGATTVVLDSASGRVWVDGGSEAEVPQGSVLQQPGPSAAFVLVGARDALLSVDLASGEVTTVADGVEGEPARPVRLGDCRYAAWAGASGAAVTACGDAGARPQALDTATSDLVFRTNRGQIVLNDRGSGHVWDVDSNQPTRLDNWDAFNLQADDTDEDDDDERTDEGDRRPPKAVRDNLGARPGRTTVLYPLDNDTAPSGRLLAIRSVRPLGGSDARLAISPDGQTVQVTLAPDAVGGTSFEYFIDDGRASISAHATVRVAISQAGSNSDPRLREGFEPRVWTVPAGGTIDVPVLPDWRDPEDGDPVSTLSSEVTSAPTPALAAAQTRITATGAVRFQAPDEGGQVAVTYAVTDGLGDPVTEVLDFTVQDPKAREPVPPTANSDVIAGETGQPITVKPLANDLPGADPIDPDAVLKLAGDVADVPGAEVTTDLVNGTVTLRSDTAQTYFLEYQAAYGSADTDTGKIRVDVRPPANPPPPPVAVPDDLTLYGQAGAVVDVLANDVDPAGGLLSVQRAEALFDNQLDVAVIEGRWLRIAARQGQLTPSPQVVRYTVTNGQQSAVGQVVVSQRRTPADDVPVTMTDDVTVREGSSQAISVLDNDFSPSGGTLTLVGGSGGIGADVPAGQLDVRAQGSSVVDTGAAFVSGRTVRYVAPTGLEGPQRFLIRYQVANEQGDTATGRVRALVLPVDPATNHPPEPQVLEGRTVSGEPVKLRLPGYGVDPDGDAVTILALDSAPTKGRVTRIGANSIDYTAYPGSAGTDEFTYRITDSLGATSTGTVRVVIAPPGPPQPPLAIADSLTVAPGRTALADVLANDLVAPGSRISLELVDPPAGVRLVSGTGPVQVDPEVTASLGEGRALEVVYRMTDGLASTQSTLTVRTRKGFNNPPVVSDAFGTAGDGTSITVDVLSAAEEPRDGVAASGSTSGAYDPDGPAEDLVVSGVYAPPGVVASIDGAEVTVERGAQPMVVPFRVEDRDGGSATASLYVPPADTNLPVVDPDALITVRPGQRRELDLADFVTNPSGGPLHLTLKSRVWASPGPAVQAEVLDEERFAVTAGPKYEGPGAVVVEVTTGTSVDDPDAARSIVSIPVLVGESRPILRCPEQPIEVPQAGFVRLDLGAVCHVWTPSESDEATLTWSAEFAEESPVGLTAEVFDRGVVEIDASGATRPGERGTLRVAAGNSLPGAITIRVVRTPPPSLAPIRITSIRAGETQTINLAPYLIPGVVDPVPTVVNARQLSGLDVQITSSGSSVTIATGADTHGRAVFRVVMSDVAGRSGPGRRVEGRIVLQVLGAPEVPSTPVPSKEILDSRVALDWRAPQANGAPIDYYEVRAQPGGRTQRCAATSCVVTGLTNLTEYRFRVRAHNAVGYSGWSGLSGPATPDVEISLGGTIRLVEAGDGFLRIAWKPLETKGGGHATYTVSWQGGQQNVTEATATIRGLDNHRTYVFTVRPRNAFGVSLTSAPFQPVGTPQTPAPPTLTDQETAGSAGAVSLTWPRVDANGPEPVRYTVYRDNRKIAACNGIKTPNCDSANMVYDGHVYSFAVMATNAGGKSSPIGPETQWRATGKPVSWGSWQLSATGQNNQARAKFTVPSSRGAESLVRIYVDGVRVRQLQGLGDQSETFDVPDNLSAHDVYLEVCNEGGACTQSSTKSVQTYGPLNQGQIHDVRANVNVRSISWTIEVDSNGDPAVLHVTSDQGRDEQFNLPIGVTTVTTQTLELDYDQTENVTVTLVDRDPDRGPASVNASATTERRPPATVAGSRGASCSDDPGAGLPACTSADAGAGGPGCTSSACAFVHLKLGGWRLDVPGTAVFCSVENGPSRPYDPLADQDTIDFYGNPGGTVSIDCFNALGQTAQTQFTW
ncbi:fibronectin type III domain-containing protein [Nocardioides agariphilus]|uniref:Fibronectin type III domain-containing protein n=1 Tax=Nocardioides agariphilus TaxID=433664 RepID=A0A930VSH0_9ACTN|nr:fibronectin type III domain-containing protein [Nocardioides agariphilus]